MRKKFSLLAVLAFVGAAQVPLDRWAGHEELWDELEQLRTLLVGAEGCIDPRSWTKFILRQHPGIDAVFTDCPPWRLFSNDKAFAEAKQCLSGQLWIRAPKNKPSARLYRSIKNALDVVGNVNSFDDFVEKVAQAAEITARFTEDQKAEIISLLKAGEAALAQRRIIENIEKQQEASTVSVSGTTIYALDTARENDITVIRRDDEWVALSDPDEPSPDIPPGRLVMFQTGQTTGCGGGV